MTLLGLSLWGAACGPAIPEHNGYKSAKVTPWRNPKAIKLDDKNEGQVDGELDYAGQKRAKWYAVDLPSDGDLQVSVEANPENDNGEFDLGFEIVGPGNRVLAKSDLEDEDAKELTKTRSLAGLTTGRYLIHLYLQGRLDNSDFEIKVKYSPKSVDVATNFPAGVRYLPSLALVPVIDDTPGTIARPSTGGKVNVKRNPQPRKPKEPDAPPATTVSASILMTSMSNRSTNVVLNVGSNAGVAEGWKGKVVGVSGSDFTVTNVTARNCRGVIKDLTAEQVSGKRVILSPN